MWSESIAITSARIVVALQTGRRYAEPRLLRWSQLDFLGHQLTVGRAKTSAGTGRVVPLNRRAFAELQRWALQFDDCRVGKRRECWRMEGSRSGHEEPPPVETYVLAPPQLAGLR